MAKVHLVFCWCTCWHFSRFVNCFHTSLKNGEHVSTRLSVEIESPWTALRLERFLLVPAVLGKLIGNGIPSLKFDGWSGALLIGANMIPRAEIAMVIVQHGLELGPWAMPSRVIAAMVFVSLVTCVLSPESRLLDA